MNITLKFPNEAGGTEERSFSVAREAKHCITDLIAENTAIEVSIDRGAPEPMKAQGNDKEGLCKVIDLEVAKGIYVEPVEEEKVEGVIEGETVDVPEGEAVETPEEEKSEE